MVFDVIYARIIELLRHVFPKISLPAIFVPNSSVFDGLSLADSFCPTFPGSRCFRFLIAWIFLF